MFNIYPVIKFSFLTIEMVIGKFIAAIFAFALRKLFFPCIDQYKLEIMLLNITNIDSLVSTLSSIDFLHCMEYTMLYEREKHEKISLR